MIDSNFTPEQINEMLEKSGKTKEELSAEYISFRLECEERMEKYGIKWSILQ